MYQLVKKIHNQIDKLREKIEIRDIISNFYCDKENEIIHSSVVFDRLKFGKYDVDKDFVEFPLQHNITAILFDLREELGENPEYTRMKKIHKRAGQQDDELIEEIVKNFKKSDIDDCLGVGCQVNYARGALCYLTESQAEAINQKWFTPDFTKDGLTMFEKEPKKVLEELSEILETIK